MRMRFLSTALLLVTGCGGGSTAAFSNDASTGGFGGSSAATGGAPSSGGMLPGTGGSSAGGVTSGTGGKASGGASAAGAAGTAAGNGGNAGAGATGAGGTTTNGGTGNAGSSGASSGGAGQGGVSGMTGMGGKGGAGGTIGSGGKAATGGKAGSGGKASTGGASGAGGASNNGPPPTVEQLVPLAVGNVWNYRTTILPGTTGTMPCPAGMHATTITGKATFQGESAFTATHFCAPTVTRYYVENAKGLEVNVGTGWSVVLPRPISDGAVFMAASSQQVIAHVADVTVPAGTFSNCWATQYLTATGAIATYCAGVGLVTLEYDAPSGGGYLVELTSYQLK